MANATDRGAFLPTTVIIDAGKESLIQIRRTFSDHAEMINNKTTGMHPLEEFVSGSTYFSDPTLNSTTPKSPVQRQEFILTINFGALPNTATKTVAHGIVFPSVTNTFRFVHIRATASDLTGTNYLPIPYASPVLANNISIDVDATNVSITTGSDRTAYTDTIVVLKYIKD